MAAYVAVYVAGLLTPVLLLGLFELLSAALATGTRVDCLRCGYSTGDIDQTRQIVVAVRSRWHSLTAHRPTSTEGTD